MSENKSKESPTPEHEAFKNGIEKVRQVGLVINPEQCNNVLDALYDYFMRICPESTSRSGDTLVAVARTILEFRSDATTMRISQIVDTPTDEHIGKAERSESCHGYSR